MDSPLPPDPYQTLGVSKSASAAQIRAAYLKLVLKCHPDKQAGITDEAVLKRKNEEFTRVQQAYEIISDDKKRHNYDERVKLAELKREVLQRNGYKSRTTDSYAPAPSVYESRNYEEVPHSHGRFFDDSDGGHRFFEEPKSSKYDYDIPQSRHSTAQDEWRRPKTSASDLSRAERDRLREAVRSGHSERRKARDRERRRETSEKHHARSAYVDSDYDSDDSFFGRRRHHDGRRSEGRHSDERRSDERRSDERRSDERRSDERRSDEKRAEERRAEERRSDERRNRDRDLYDGPSRSSPSKRRGDIIEEVIDIKESRKEKTARDYIESSKRTAIAEEFRHGKGVVAFLAGKVLSKHSDPLQELRHDSSGRPILMRSSSKATRSSPRDRKHSIDVSGPRGGYESRRAAAAREMGQPHRSNSEYIREASKHDGPRILRRSETTPLASSRRDRDREERLAKLKLKTSSSHDSGYSSPSSPEHYSSKLHPSSKSTTYTFVEEEEEYPTSRGYRTVFDVLNSSSRHRRDSPSPLRHSMEHSSVVGRHAPAKHVPSARGSSYMTQSEVCYSSRDRERGSAVPPLSRYEPRGPTIVRGREPPSLARGQSARGELFGDKEYEIRYAEPITRDKIIYTDIPRRGSAPNAKDVFPPGYYPEGRHPGLSRAESYA